MPCRFIKAALLVLIAFASIQGFAKSDPDDQQGSKDPAPFDRMSNFYIYRYQELDFDRYEFPIGTGKSQAVEGRHTYVHYYGKEGAKFPSGLQIVRNSPMATQSAPLMASQTAPPRSP